MLLFFSVAELLQYLAHSTSPTIKTPSVSAANVRDEFGVGLTGHRPVATFPSLVARLGCFWPLGLRWGRFRDLASPGGDRAALWTSQSSVLVFVLAIKS